MTPGYDATPLAFTPELDVEREVRVAPPEVEGKRARTLWNREEKLMRPPRVGLWSVYCDGSLSPKGQVRAHVESWLQQADVALFKHPHRTCAYAEIDACVARGKITAEEATQARGTLMLSGFPKDFGLWALGVIVRRVHLNTTQDFIFPMCWEMTKHITRDQIWFPFVLWKIKNASRRIHTIDLDIFNNNLFTFTKHR